MKVNYALILAAGFGTRMGELGKELPKVLWPIMNRKILGLQIDHLKSIGIKNIYVNTHYLSDKIHSFLDENYPDVKVLFEPEILGSGGAIHNLAAQDDIDYKGNLLVINGDQFYMYDESTNDALMSDTDFSVRLLAIDVEKDSSYSGLIVQDGLLKEIRPKEYFKEEYITFSGISYINLDKLERVDGVSNYFESVAPYKSNKIEVIFPEKQEYWDFGTKDLYVSNMVKLKQSYETNTTSKFISFCKNNKISIEKRFYNDDGTMNLYIENIKRVI